MTNGDNLKPIREILKTRRAELGITQEELAKSIGKSPRTIMRYENGETTIPFSILVEICKVLDMDLMFSRGRE